VDYTYKYIAYARAVHRVALDPPPEEITREYVYEINEVIR
jgi:hypothetical protein